jgi:hypothetical protein
VAQTQSVLDFIVSGAVGFLVGNQIKHTPSLFSSTLFD